MRYVLYHKEMGVYLGGALGLGFWSLLDSVGQPAACTFPSEKEAVEYLDSWDENSNREGIIPWPVDTNNRFATIKEIVESGLPGWTICSKTPVKILRNVT